MQELLGAEDLCFFGIFWGAHISRPRKLGDLILDIYLTTQYQDHPVGLSWLEYPTLPH